LRVVVQAIDEVFNSFEQRGEDKSSVRSLKYCNDAVERRFADWSRARVGKSETAKEIAEDDAGISDADIRTHIDQCLAQFKIPHGLPETVRSGLEKVKSELQAIHWAAGSETEFDSLDLKIDGLLIAERDSLVDVRLARIIDSRLLSLGVAGDQTAAEKVACAAIREEYGIPRLSLYKL
jgi:hypothetical protein